MCSTIIFAKEATLVTRHVKRTEPIEDEARCIVGVLQVEDEALCIVGGGGVLRKMHCGCTTG